MASRGRPRTNSHFLSLTEWMNLLEDYNHACAYCGKTGVRLTKDHVQPVSRGGRNHVSNIVPACEECNHAKGDMTLEEWREEQEIARWERKEGAA